MMMKLPKDLTREEREVTNRSSDYFVGDMCAACVTLFILFGLVLFVVWF